MLERNVVVAVTLTSDMSDFYTHSTFSCSLFYWLQKLIFDEWKALARKNSAAII